MSATTAECTTMKRSSMVIVAVLVLISLPAFVVFTDATLTAIAEAKPSTLEELAALAGVGPSKLEKYGEHVLRVLVESTTL